MELQSPLLSERFVKEKEFIVGVKWGDYQEHNGWPNGLCLYRRKSNRLAMRCAKDRTVQEATVDSWMLKRIVLILFLLFLR